jgi:hypothetical protein
MTQQEAATTEGAEAPSIFHHLDAEGNVIKDVNGDPVAFKKPQRVRVRTPKEPKLYQQFNEDGTPQLNEDGTHVMGETKPVKLAKVRAPKPVVYELNEDGTQKLDEAGNPIVVKATRAPAVRRVPNNEGAIITISEEQATKIAAYKGARGEEAKPLANGQTVGDFYAAGGDKGFLRFYVRDGAVTITSPTEEAKGPVEV